MVVRRAVEALRKSLGRAVVRAVRRRTVSAGIRAAGVVDFLGRPLATRPGVFHPVAFSSSQLLAERLCALDLAGAEVLDMGTGAGPIAVTVAARGARVTAVDRNPDAVALASENLRTNGLSGEVLESDLFDGVRGRSFDLVVFNVPFYEGEPTSHWEAAFYAGRDLSTIARFARGCREHLRAGGTVWIVFSEDSDRTRMLAAFTAEGFFVAEEQRPRAYLEVFHVVALRRRGAER